MLKIVGFHLAIGTLASLILAAEPSKEKAEKKEEPAAQKNLIVNGDFDEGEITPKGWQTIDGLTSFWEKDEDPKRGKVLKLDTDVLQKQAYDWWVKIHGGSSPKDAPAKTPSTDPNKYDTLAAFDGTFFWSDAIPVKKGQSYWLTLDVKGPAGMMVWLVGYRDKPDVSFAADMAAPLDYIKDKISPKPREKGRDFDGFIHKYEWKGQLVVGGSDTWKTYSRRKQAFRPTANTPKVKWVRVFLLPYWPPGTYYVDNVRLVEVDE